MEKSPVTIECANPNCQAPNPLENRFCHQCRTPLLKNYLWALGSWITVYRTGELIEGRYLLKRKRIVLDTKPGLPPGGPEEIPLHIQPYLKLLPYRLHIPQIYGYLPSRDEELNLEIWFLEYGTVPTDGEGELRHHNLLPELRELWSEAGPLRQLNWLWQAAQLWEPLEQQGVASSLLEPSLARINGGLLQLLELRWDGEPAPSLSQLGECWAPWAASAAPPVADFLGELCQQLREGNIQQASYLAELLQAGMSACAQGQQHTYEIFTATDKGPTRDHNEDACYPPPGETVTVGGETTGLTIVCDGIGGQEAGEVASQLAVEVLVKEIQGRLARMESVNPAAYCQILKLAIAEAHRAIYQRNEREQRQERQRMGTTLVMGLTHGHELHLANLGDSRAYRITPDSCHQVTVDDDLASREVRLGFLLYRDAIEYPNAGALVQALGTSDASSSQPAVQSFVLDGDCVFLLCSDGLSDGDRVEQYWPTEVVPLLRGEKDVGEVVRRLVEIANRENGHDNVTVALLYCQVQPRADFQFSPLSFADVAAALPPPPPLPLPEAVPAAVEAAPAPVPTPIPREIPLPAAPQPQPRQQWLPLTLLALAMAVVGGIAYSFWRLYSPPQLSSPEVAPSPTPTLTLVSGQFLEARKTLKLSPTSGDLPEGADLTDPVPPGSLLRVRQAGPDAAWVELEVCQLPAGEFSDSPAATPLFLPEGERGWIRAGDLNSSSFTPVSLEGKSLGKCQPLPPEREAEGNGEKPDSP